MIDYLQKTLGIKASIYDFDYKNSIPFYLRDIYKFSILKISDQKFIYLENIDELPSVKNVNKHLKVIEEKCGLPCILGIPQINSYQRKTFIQNKISFIVPYCQLFIPCLGFLLSEKISKTKSTTSVQCFTPATQIIFMYLLYDKTFNEITPTDAAKKLNLSIMTMVRSFNALKKLGLVTVKHEGVKKIFSPSSEKKVLFDQGKNFLRLPIVKKIYTNNIELLQKTPISGLQALSNKTMINPPDYEIRAIKKDDRLLKNIHDYTEVYLDQEGFFELELWSYNPNLFEEEGIINMVSLISIFKDTQDERIQIEINKLMEEYQW